MHVKNMDERVKLATERVGKEIRSLPLWVQSVIVGASVGLLIIELLQYLVGF